MLTDIEISSRAKLNKIETIAKKLNIRQKDLYKFGDYYAKVKGFENYISKKNMGKLILVTAMSPNKFGIGKTTVSIGLADAFKKLNESVCLALREPSLGPVFGIKGGAAGGGYSQVLPMEDINLNFTGDFDAITSANNLLCAMIDNHIFYGNEFDIDPEKIYFHRCLDVNDRSLREINYVIDSKDKDGNVTKISRKESFTITSASEMMAICCLSTSYEDLKKRLGDILVAESRTGKLIYARDLKAEGSMAVLLRNVLAPNLTQTLAHTPAFVHLGPFANIAHGCNSIIATKLSMSLADYTITEAGFGSDLGAEKFMDTKCRLAGISPNAVVLVATIRGLKFHGGLEINPEKSQLQLIEDGLENLYHHIDVLKNTFNASVVVTLNKYDSDTKEEIDLVVNKLKERNVDAVINECFMKGGDGAIDLAKTVLKNISNKNISYAYDFNDSVEQKIKDIVKRVYGGKNVIFSELAKQKLDFINKNNFSKLPVIIAKTQYSLSDDLTKLGCPKDFDFLIRDLEVKNGAGFIVAVAGKMMLMPGLSKIPNAVKIDILKDGTIVGLS